MNNLMFRRQFILCNKEITIDQTWKRIKLSKISTGFFLYVHPDLEYHQVVKENVEILLLGFVIDPYKPQQSSEDILNEMASLSDYESLLTKTDTLSGRFAIIYNDTASVKLCNDATGFREIYFYNDKQTIACGSSSKIIADFFEIPKDKDPEIIKFFESEVFTRVGRRWIGTRTVYKNVYHLTPNHYLDLISGKTHRFWPVNERKEIKPAEAAKIISEILTGTYDAATRRYNLYQGLTGGWDTRLLLSAARNYLNKIHFYFIRGLKSDVNLGNSLDYIISKSIAKKNSIPIEIIMLDSESIDDEFKKTYYNNNVLSRSSLLPAYYDAKMKKLDDTMNVAGSGSNETLRLLSTIHRNVSDSKTMASDLGYGDFSYVVDAIDEWLKESLPLKSKNYRMIDLFSWEQHFGNWGSLSGSEQDIVREELRPFNNRKLISTYNSLHDRYRYKDFPIGHVETIKLLWKDLLSFDLDMKLPKFKSFLRQFGVEQATDKIYQHIKALR
jgi:hypothetical protein